MLDRKRDIRSMTIARERALSTLNAGAPPWTILRTLPPESAEQCPGSLLAEAEIANCPNAESDGFNVWLSVRLRFPNPPAPS